MTRRFLSVVLILAGAILGVACAADPSADDETLRGRIAFPTSATGPAQQQFIQGVLALHSFWYPEARDRFRSAQELQPDFAMAYWGEAMSYDNALGVIAESGDDAQERLGAEVLQRLDELDAQGRLRWSGREQGYVEAVRQRFRLDLSHSERRVRYFEAMRSLAREYPDDMEAVAFAALALMSLPGFDIEQPNHVVSVAGRLEEQYELNPEHPGVLHYLIHVYDTETFALMGLRQARHYAEIAPAAPHALHMPSHIFRHLGMWEDVATSNEAAYEASVNWQENTGRPLSSRDFHALDWLMGAYLQLQRYDDAREIVELVSSIEAEIDRRGEEPGQVPAVARHLREYYEASVNQGAPPEAVTAPGHH